MQSIRTWGVVLGAVFGTFAIVLLTLVLWPGGRDVTMADQDEGMGGMETATPGTGGMATPATTVRFPPVAGLYEGEEILFIHSEASDEQIAQTLTQMMGGSPVLVVPALADVPASALANVYVFTNGVQPAEAMGPLGFQPDVFDSAPGDETYSPLRAVQLVTWAEGAEPRVLRSAEDILTAEQAGEVTIEQPGVVVNMPFLTWPGGHR